MRLEIRIYKRHDLDLLSLRQQGIPILGLMEEAIVAFANRKPLKILIPHVSPYVPDQLNVYHAGLDIRDENAVRMLEAVNPDMRNQFCKNVLRDALVVQTLGIYFKDQYYHGIDDERRLDAGKQPGILVCNPNKKKKVTLKEVLSEKRPKRSRVNLTPVTEASVLIPMQGETPQEPAREEVSVYSPAPAQPEPEPQEPARTQETFIESPSAETAPESETPPDSTEAALLDAQAQNELMEMMKDIF